MWHRRCPPTPPVATLQPQQQRRWLWVDAWRRRRRIAEHALPPVAAFARILGIKRPICRPMIASAPSTWFDSASARLLLAAPHRRSRRPLATHNYRSENFVTTQRTTAADDRGRLTVYRAFVATPRAASQSVEIRRAARGPRCGWPRGSLTNAVIAAALHVNSFCRRRHEPPRQNLHWDRATSTSSLLSSSSSHWVGDLALDERVLWRMQTPLCNAAHVRKPVCNELGLDFHFIRIHALMHFTNNFCTC